MTGGNSKKPVYENLPDLLKACRNGEERAQKQLYDTWGTMIYTVVRRYVRDEHLAKDMMSEALCNIFAKLGQYAFEGKFEGWMQRVTINTITDNFRKNWRHTDAGRNEVEDEHASVSNEAISNLSYKELMQHVHDLPDMARTVFNLFVFEQYPHKEIGAMLGITESNSRWHLNSARQRLKEKILMKTR